MSEKSENSCETVKNQAVETVKAAKPKKIGLRLKILLFILIVLTNFAVTLFACNIKLEENVRCIVIEVPAKVPVEKKKTESKSVYKFPTERRLPPCDGGCAKDLEEKMLYWIIYDTWPEREIAEKYTEVPAADFPQDYMKNNFYRNCSGNELDTIGVSEMDLDDDGLPERLVYSGSGNRNCVRDLFKKINGKWQYIGIIGGIDFVPLKYNGKTGIFSKWGNGFACASYSFQQIINDRLVTVIDFDIDGSAQSVPGKLEEIVITLRSNNNFMKNQYQMSSD